MSSIHSLSDDLLAHTFHFLHTAQILVPLAGVNTWFRDVLFSEDRKLTQKLFVDTELVFDKTTYFRTTDDSDEILIQEIIDDCLVLKISMPSMRTINSRFQSAGEERPDDDNVTRVNEINRTFFKKKKENKTGVFL